MNELWLQLKHKLTNLLTCSQVQICKIASSPYLHPLAEQENLKLESATVAQMTKALQAVAVRMLQV
jgi:hypothetical protein